MNKIEKNNKLIVRFMGWADIGANTAAMTRAYLNCYHVELPCFEGMMSLHKMEFNKSWDWLMPVFDKIEQMHYETEITRHSVAFGSYMAVGEIDWHYEVDRYEEISLIDSVYKGVLGFIKWYNENK